MSVWKQFPKLQRLSLPPSVTDITALEIDSIQA
jgi:hypothetical protein